MVMINDLDLLVDTPRVPAKGWFQAHYSRVLV